MDLDSFKEVKRACAPLIKLRPIVKAIWVYGSAVEKQNVRGSDIDILILLDDTQKSSHYLSYRSYNLSYTFYYFIYNFLNFCVENKVLD